jgi:mono/diheme cytochrome c family protein
MARSRTQADDLAAPDQRMSGPRDLTVVDAKMKLTFSINQMTRAQPSHRPSFAALSEGTPRPTGFGRGNATRCVIGVAVALAGLVGGCSSSSSGGGGSLRIVNASATSSASLQAVAGDALPLKVVVVDDDGSTHDLPADATVTWTSPATVTALPSDSTADSPIPAPGAQPTAGWIANPGRTDLGTSLANVLFVFDAGTTPNGSLQVSATVTGGTPSGDVTASIAVGPTPAGDATRGATLYGATGANCAECHGATGHGSPEGPDATSFTIMGATYDFPSPGLNAEDGNVAGDPEWTPALLAVSAYSAMDNGGLTLRLPMPGWLAQPNSTTGKPFTAQDFADIYAFLKTQTQ